MALWEEVIIAGIIAVISALGGGVSASILFRVGTESRLVKLENEIALLEPIKQILLEKGKEHVIKQFKGEKA